MRWLVVLTALLSACGLSEHGGSERPRSSSGGATGDASARAGSGDSAGSSMQAGSEPRAGAGGATARTGAERPGVSTAAAGNGSGTAGAAPIDGSGAAGSGMSSSAGKAGGGAPGAGGQGDDGGESGEEDPVGPSGYALHFEVQAFADELIPLFDAQLDGGWVTPHTFEAWFRTKSDVAPLVSAYDDDTWGAISLVVVNGGLCLHYEVGVNPPFHDICTQTRNLDDGAWHHAAVIFNDSRVQLFEDGASALDASVDLTLPDLLDRLNLGTGPVGSEGQTNFLEGDLDEVRVWRGARTPSEIMNYRAMELPPSQTPDGDGNYLLAYLRLNDGTGAMTLEDLGAASNRPAELNVHETADPWITPGAF